MYGNNFIIIQDDGTLLFAEPSRKGGYKWFQDGAWLRQDVHFDNVFPSTTDGLQSAHQRAIEVRHAEVLDNHFDNPSDQSNEAELRVLEQIIAA